MRAERIKQNDPVLMSIQRIEMNLHKLKQIGPYGNANSLWETAGHIWSATYWICELTKNPKNINDAWDIRLALSHLISSRPVDSFEYAIEKITESYKKIGNRLV